MEPTALPDWNDEDRAALLALARRVVEHGGSAAPIPIDRRDFSEALQQKRAAFVSVYVADQLRGCTGELIPSRSLVECVAHQARSAAFTDDRFPPVQPDELDRLRIEVSVLGLPEPIQFESEEELLEKLEPNVDGLTIDAFGRKATFLPLVWKSLPNPTDFLAQLKLKAGLPLDPIPELRASRYRTDVFSDSGRKAA